MTTDLVLRDTSHAVEILSVARAALQEAETLPEITDLIDKAEIVRVLGRKIRISQDAQNDWAEYKLDAERKAGAVLSATPRLAGGRPAENPLQDAKGLPPSLKDLGVEYWQSHRWQQVASIPEPDYEDFKRQTREAGEEISEAGALRLAKQIRKENEPPGEPPDINVFADSLRQQLARILDPTLDKSAKNLADLVTYKDALRPVVVADLVRVLKHVGGRFIKYAEKLS